MCRLMAYLGHPMLVADVVLWPDRSIIKQSYDARERLQDPTLPSHVGFGNLNGDGFGIGWFPTAAAEHRDPCPCVFTSITPAWNNENLARLSRKIVSPVIFAHVRAAYPGMPVSEQNCHPFQWGRYLWMHNGVVGGFNQIRRSLLGTLKDEAYDTIQSFHSDSAVSFAVYLHHLPDLRKEHPPDVLLQAMQDTLATISRIQQQHGIQQTSLLNFVVSDGATLIATRYVYPAGEKAASLYYAEGEDFVRNRADADPALYFQGSAATSNTTTTANGAGGSGTTTCSGNGHNAGSSILHEAKYSLTHGERGASVAFISSEPITGSTTDWVAVPPNTALVVTREKSGYLNILRAPLPPPGEALDGEGTPGREMQLEVSRCLEAVSRGLNAKAQIWVAKRASAVSVGGCDGGSCGGKGGPESPTRNAGHDLYIPLRRTASQEPEVTGDAEEHRMTGHTGSVLRMAVDEDAGLLFTSSVDCTVKVWELEGLCCVRTIHGHKKPVTQLQLHEGHLYTTAGGIIRVYSTATFACVYALKTSFYSGGIRSLCICSQGRLYVGNQDTSIKLFTIDHTKFREDFAASWDDSKSEIAPADLVSDTASGHVGPVNALALSGQYLCSGGGDAMIRVWDMHTLKLVRVLRGHRGSILCLLALGNLLLSGARDNLIRVWDLDMDMMCRRTLLGHKDDVVHLSSVSLRRRHATAGDGDFAAARYTQMPSFSLVASASADGTVRLWSSNWTCVHIFSLAPTAPMHRHSAPSAITAAALSCAVTRHHVIGGYTDNAVRLWHMQELSIPTVHNGPLDHSSAGRAGGANGPSSDPSTFSGAGWVSPSGVTPKGEQALTNGHHLNAHLNAQANGHLNAPPNGGTRCPRLGTTECGCAGSMDRTLINSLRNFISIRTVSAVSKHRDDCCRGAKYLARLLEGLGADIKLATSTDEMNPVVIGRLGHNSSNPTITFYGHYDVQPAQEPDWESNPFKMTAVDGYLYGRGTSDNKGPILAFVYAVKEMLDCWTAEGKGLPVNVAFIFEGEEENGSRGFKETLTQNLRWFEDTDLIVISNTVWVGENVPCLTYGMRGMISASIQVTGPEKDLHSGNDGGVFHEPMVDLCKLMATLRDDKNRVTVPGFSDGVRPKLMDLAWARLKDSAEFSLEGYQASLRIPRLTAPPSAQDLLAARWCAPTLSVVDVMVTERRSDGGSSRAGANEDMDPSYRFGPTRFSVIPKMAVGKVSARFVPEQDAQALIGCLRQHVETEFAKLGSNNRVSLEVHSIGDWWDADPESRLFKMAERAVRKEWGCEPLYVREGGTMPVASLTEKLLGAPALMIPLGQASDSCHLANERIRQLNLLRGKNVVRHLMEELAQL